MKHVAALAGIFAFGFSCPVMVFAQGDTLPALTAEKTPVETREVVAEGRAAIAAGGVAAARQAAIAMALRGVVEKTTGVYVAARSTTVNYTLLHDEVITRAEGFATLKEVVRETVLPTEVRVTVRAVVSLRPVAERLKELGLTRAWRVYVQNDVKNPVAVTELENALSEAGFVVTSSPKEAEVTVQVLPRFSVMNKTELDTAAGPMTMYSVRGTIALRAVRTGTRELIAGFTATDSAAHIDNATAHTRITTATFTRLAPSLTDALLLLPAQDSLPLTLTVSNLTRGAAQVGKLEDALSGLPGVRRVLRRGYAKGQATWELDVLTDAQPQVARMLEESPLFRAFRLNVASENRTQIIARAGK